MAAKKPSPKKMKDLPKKLSAKELSSVKGGTKAPTESLSFGFGKVAMKYD